MSNGAVFAQATRLVFQTGTTGNVPGQPFQVQPVVEAQDAAGATDFTFEGPVTLTIKTGDGKGGAVLSGPTTVNAVAGFANFSDLSINTPGSYRLTATSGALTGDSASITVPLTISEVYTSALPTGLDQATAINGAEQVRSFAVNRVPGSPWAGTVYLPRRAAGAPADVFYWRGKATNVAAAPGSGTLTTQGPDWTHPDGKFDTAALAAAGYNPAAGNSFWAIGVASDNYVYVTGLTSGALARFDADGTNPAVVVAAPNFPRIRQMYVTGSGAVSNNAGNPTTIWYFTDAAASKAEKWVAQSLDTGGKPAGFTKTSLFTVADNPSQVHQSVVNSTRDTLFYTFYYTGAGPGPTPQKYSVTGVKDTSFPVYTLSLGSGLAIDSSDRALYEGYPNGQHPFVALSPRNGQNILNDGAGNGGGQYIPSVNWSYQFSDYYVELGRFSDRHYFYWGNATNGSSLGVFSTDMPAAPPLGVTAADAGLGGKVNLAWTLPVDTEVTGVNVYRSTNPTSFNFAAPTYPNQTGGALVDSGLTNGTAYYYVVRTVAKDPFTNTSYESANLTPISATPTAGQPAPSPVTNVTATDTKAGGEVVLAWTDPSPAGTLEHVNVYRSTSSGSLGTKLDTVAKGVQTYADKAATNGTPYYYTLKAANGSDKEAAGVLAQPAPVTPTDQTAPTFAGLKTLTDYGFPGFRLAWDAATDNSGPITYKVYATTTPGGFNFAAPDLTTTDTTADLKGLTVGQDVYLLVRATDALGNTSTTDKVVAATPTRVIVDSDQNALVNFDKFNPQPDPGFPALVPAGVGVAKGSGEPDLISSGFAAGLYYFNTNDKKGKVQFTVPINAAGTYEISAFWNPSTNAAAMLNTPNYVYHVTLPNGQQLPDITLDMVNAPLDPNAPRSNRWNLLTTQTLTPGNLIIVGDATQSTSVAPPDINVSGAVRARIVITPSNVPIYRAATAPTVDGNINASEWAGAPILALGRASQDVLPGKWSGPADYNSNVQLKWDSNNLYVAASVTDDVVSFPQTNPDQLSNRDGLEIYLGLSPAAAPRRTV
jgi:hypothetical protein